MLVIVIVIAVLILINPFGATPQCIFSEPGFRCNLPATPVLSTNGLLQGSLTNGQKSMVRVMGIRCVSGTTMQNLTSSTTFVDVVPGASMTFQSIVPGARCGEPTDNIVSGVWTSTTTPKSYAAGSQFRGKLWIYYRYKPDVITTGVRSASANIVAQVV